MTTAGGTRYRIVTHTAIYGVPAEEHVSHVVLAHDEIAEYLEIEWFIHCKTGWNAWTQESETDGFRACVFEKDGVRRTVDARAFTPHDDVACTRAV